MKTKLKKYQKVLSLIHQLTPSLLWYAGFYALMNVLLPYFALFLTAIVLNGLLNKLDFQQLFLRLSAISIGILIVQLLQHFFEKKRDDAMSLLDLRLKEAVTLQLLSISYFQLQDPKMREMYQKAKDGTNYSGGMNTFIRYFLESFLNGTMALVIGSIALIRLQLSHGQTDSDFARLINGWGFGILLLLVLILPWLFNLFVSTKTNRLQSELFDFFTRINRQSTYLIQSAFDYKNGPIFRLYQANQIFYQQIKDYDAEFIEVGIEIDKKSSNLKDGGAFTNDLFMIPLFILVAAKAYFGSIEIGSVLLFTGYFTQMSQRVNDMFQQISRGNMLVDFLDFYFDFLAISPESNGSLPIEKRSDHEYEIEFHDVGFQYPDSTEWTLRHLDTKLNIGEKTAIVGKNGSGKSTFIKLLARLYPVTEGKITLNGIDINKYDPEEYQQILAIVFQDFKLFSFTAAENVAANQQFNTERVEEALYIAGIDQRFAQETAGIHSTLYKHLDDNGMEISGGEAQKIAIARAWYKDAPFVILDEPTSALDPFAEYEIYRRFDELVQDKTSIYISHRMSSARFSDRILVFDGGRISQEGSHTQLIQESGLYQQLFQAQAQYYADDLTAEQLKTLFH